VWRELHGIPPFAEMSDTLELVVAGRRAGPGGLASIHDSGGERVLFADEAAGVGVPSLT